MATKASVGLEQARIELPSIIANANAGIRTIITKHGKPWAAVVPLEDVKKSRVTENLASGFLTLRGSGAGLWGADVGQAVDDLRNEWDV